MFRVVHEVDIAAPAATVFDIITDIARYPEWNPWNVRGEGVVAEGAVVRATARIGKREMVVAHRILDLKRDEIFRWCDLGWFTVLVYGETAHHLQARGDQVRYRAELTITGPLAWLVKLWLGARLERGLLDETLALKAHAEAAPRTAGGTP
jgi:hypothetical protein